MKDKYTYLAGFQFSYEDRKYQNVIHMAFEAKDIANIKSDEFLFRKSSSASDRRDTISNDINGKWSQWFNSGIICQHNILKSMRKVSKHKSTFLWKYRQGNQIDIYQEFRE